MFKKIGSIVSVCLLVVLMFFAFGSVFGVSKKSDVITKLSSNPDHGPMNGLVTKHLVAPSDSESFLCSKTIYDNLLEKLFSGSKFMSNSFEVISGIDMENVPKNFSVDLILDTVNYNSYLLLRTSYENVGFKGSIDVIFTNIFTSKKRISTEQFCIDKNNTIETIKTLKELSIQTSFSVIPDPILISIAEASMKNGIEIHDGDTIIFTIKDDLKIENPLQPSVSMEVTSLPWEIKLDKTELEDLNIELIVDLKDKKYYLNFYSNNHRGHGKIEIFYAGSQENEIKEIFIPPPLA